MDHLAKNSVQIPRMMWQDTTGQIFSLDGRPMSLATFCNMYVELLSQMSALLHDEVLLELSLSDLYHAPIFDNLSNTTLDIHS